MLGQEQALGPWGLHHLSRNIPDSLLFYFRPFHTQFKYKLKKRRCCACDSNPGPQNGRHRRIHWAMSAALPKHCLQCPLKCQLGCSPSFHFCLAIFFIIKLNIKRLHKNKSNAGPCCHLLLNKLAHNLLACFLLQRCARYNKRKSKFQIRLYHCIKNRPSPTSFSFNFVPFQTNTNTIFTTN